MPGWGNVSRSDTPDPRHNRSGQFRRLEKEEKDSRTGGWAYGTGDGLQGFIGIA